MVYENRTTGKHALIGKTLENVGSIYIVPLRILFIFVVSYLMCTSLTYIDEMSYNEILLKLEDNLMALVSPGWMSEHETSSTS